MNERIQELAYQAEEYADTMVDGGSEFHPEFCKKFAELIVRECAEVGHDSVEDGDDIDSIMRRVHNNILKHFGVEE